MSDNEELEYERTGHEELSNALSHVEQFITGPGSCLQTFANELRVMKRHKAVADLFELCSTLLCRALDGYSIDLRDTDLALHKTIDRLPYELMSALGKEAAQNEPLRRAFNSMLSEAFTLSDEFRVARVKLRAEGHLDKEGKLDIEAFRLPAHHSLRLVTEEH